MKQWFLCLIIISLFHGLVLLGTAPIIFSKTQKVVVAYHQGEEAGVKYKVSLISKKVKSTSARTKQSTNNKKNEIHTKRKSESNAGGAQSKPKLVGKFAPPYPSSSRRLREQGDVTLNFTVDTDGHVKNIKLLKSSGHHRLDLSAKKYIKQQIFTPAQLEGTAVKSVQELTITYRLE